MGDPSKNTAPEPVPEPESEPQNSAPASTPSPAPVDSSAALYSSAALEWAWRSASDEFSRLSNDGRYIIAYMVPCCDILMIISAIHPESDDSFVRALLISFGCIAMTWLAIWRMFRGSFSDAPMIEDVASLCKATGLTRQQLAEVKNIYGPLL